VAAAEHEGQTGLYKANRSKPRVMMMMMAVWDEELLSSEFYLRDLT